MASVRKLLLALVPLALALLPSAAQAAPAARILCTTADDLVLPSNHPRSCAIVEGQASSQVLNFRRAAWRGWGTARATATAEVHIPQGGWVKATLTAYHLRTTKHVIYPLYTRLRVSFDGQSGVWNPGTMPSLE
jgi:hypothetical protein